MKTRIPQSWLLAVSLLSLPLVGGCNQESSNQPAKTNSTSAPKPVGAAAPASDSPAIVLPDGVAAQEPPAQVEPAPAAAEKPLPTGINPSPNLAEVIKLAQAGVDERVLLSFVTNSAGTFNLGSDAIIYLNDIGVSGDVITSMIEHDRAMAQPVQTPASAANEAVAAAPSPDNATETTADTQPDATTTYTAEPVQQPVSTTYFYSSLAPYGTWVDLGGYGYCWQPSVAVVNPSWRPYCDGGRWVYSDCGWYWLSDYSWGSSAFHYGRWFTHPSYGWCWRPDTVWGPSWVTWRYSPGYCGWAPLPPAACYTAGAGLTWGSASVGVSFGFGLSAGCYTFVPLNHFSDHHPNRHLVARNQANQVFNNSTAINNIVQGDNNTVINHGVSADRVAAATRTEIRPVPVRDWHDGRGRSPAGRGERLEREGDRLVLLRPRPIAPVRSDTAHDGRPARGAAATASTPAATVAFSPVTAPTTPPANATGNSSRVDRSPRTGTTERPPDSRGSITTPSMGRAKGGSPSTSERTERVTAPPGSVIVFGRPNRNAVDSASAPQAQAAPRENEIRTGNDRSNTRQTPATVNGAATARSAPTHRSAGALAPSDARNQANASSPPARSQQSQRVNSRPPATGSVRLAENAIRSAPVRSAPVFSPPTAVAPSVSPSPSPARSTGSPRASASPSSPVVRSSPPASSSAQAPPRSSSSESATSSSRSSSTTSHGRNERNPF